MLSRMKALVYQGPESFEIADIPTPDVSADQVLIMVDTCGICKTDLHIHRGKFIAQFPLVPGHEFAGEVAEVGSRVTGFEPGDRVTADNAVPCGHCYYCRRDKPLYCENFYSLGCNAPGGFAEYVVVRHDKVFHLPEHVSFDEAAFTEPTACVVHCMDVVDIRPGDDVLLIGAGPAGLVLAQAIANSGASRLVVAAPTKSKLEIARALGADETVTIDRSDLGSSKDEILGLAPKGYDVIFDATGSGRITEQCPQFAKYGGKIVVFGVPDEDEKISVSPYDIYRREISLIGSFAQVNRFPRALDYIANGIVKTGPIVTHSFPLEEYAAALEVLSGDREALKIMIKPQQA
jgi:D-arabinitol dehydrogenase (NADP+)